MVNNGTPCDAHNNIIHNRQMDIFHKNVTYCYTVHPLQIFSVDQHPLSACREVAQFSGPAWCHFCSAVFSETWLSYTQNQVKCIYSSARNGYPGTRVATRYPGTRSGSGYPGIFITRLLSTQHCRLDCEFDVIDNIYHKSTANLRAHCKYYNCTTQSLIIAKRIGSTAYLLISVRQCATIWRETA